MSKPEKVLSETLSPKNKQTNLEASLDPSELRVTETTPRLWSLSSCFTLSPPSLIMEMSMVIMMVMMMMMIMVMIMSMMI